MSVLIRELLDIPTQVHKGDFVLRLTEGVTHPQQTLQSYVVTPELATRFVVGGAPRFQVGRFGFCRSAPGKPRRGRREG